MEAFLSLQQHLWQHKSCDIMCMSHDLTSMSNDYPNYSTPGSEGIVGGGGGGGPALGAGGGGAEKLPGAGGTGGY